MSVKFNFFLDPNKVKISEEDLAIINKTGHKVIFESLLNYCLGKKYPNGVSGQTLRIANKIYGKLDEVEGNSIDLEQSEFELLKDLFVISEIPILPQNIRLFSYYSGIVESLLLSK